MNSIQKVMDYIARNTLKRIFIVILIASLFIKAMYSFDDSPYFICSDIYDMTALVLVSGVYYLLYRKREWIQEHLNYKLCFICFIAAAVVYVCLVPLSPFSDMGGIYRGAISFSKLQWEEMLKDTYWSEFPGNLKLSIFWGLLILPFPKTLMTLKILNILMIYGVIYYTRKLANVYGVKYYNLVYVFLLLFLPLFLYANHVYFDTPLILFCTMAMYVYKKSDHMILTGILLGFAGFLRKNALIFLLAIYIVSVFEKWKIIKSKKDIKMIGMLLAGIASFVFLYKVPGAVMNHIFIQENFKSYPAWNQIYIGLNEEEFGFMDHDFSYDRSVQDVLHRIQEYGPYRMSKIIIKKTFWLWSQGTYQAQRYAFGPDVISGADKFEYETVLTDYLLTDSQFLRRCVNLLMRTEYLVVFGLMVLSMFKTRRYEQFRVFYYIITATFLIMLVYELKSRYILHLLPFMMIMAGDGTEMIAELNWKKDSRKGIR